MSKQQLVFSKTENYWEATFSASGETQSLWICRKDASITNRGFKVIATMDDEQITIGEYPDDGSRDLHFTVRENPEITVKLISFCPVQSAYILGTEDEETED